VTLVDAMLGNAAVAALLALVALFVGCVVRSPAIRHAVWVIVLLKLVTPPLFDVPLRVLPAPATPHPEVRNPNFEIRQQPVEHQSADAAAVSGSAFPIGLVDWLIAAWVVGAVAWFAWQGRRVVRFRRRVRNAEDAPPEVVEAAARIAEALGLTRVPGVKLVAGIGSPMLWGWGGGAVVLFPRDLLARLSPEARDTLLAHELAHFLRRDHWVRVLEFVATGLYWWHPAVWLARNGIEAAEEQCCDAWVVGGLAASPRRYAEALLATVDYEAELRRPCLPPGACAANRGARLLHRRLVGIIDASRPRPLRGGVAVRTLVIVALLTQPVLRAAPPKPAEQPPEPSPATARSPRPYVPPTPPAPKSKEPRAWATAEAPGGGLTVVARDREVLLRHADGTTYALGPGRPIALAFAPDGRRVATAGPGPLVRTWDDRGTLVGEARVAAVARSVAYTSDGGALLVLDAAGGITVLDPQALTTVTSWTVEGPANSIVCAPNGRTVAVSFGSWLGETGWVECWSIAERRRLVSYPAPTPVGAARFSPDGTRLVMGGWSGLTTWLSLPDGKLVAERQLSKDAVATAAFSPEAGTLPWEPPPEPAPPPTLADLDGPARPPVWVQGSGQSPPER
jgi:beta-lactamase regulating signal transducer with metallopeptidase domain